MILLQHVDIVEKQTYLMSQVLSHEIDQGILQKLIGEHYKPTEHQVNYAGLLSDDMKDYFYCDLQSEGYYLISDNTNIYAKCDDIDYQKEIYLILRRP